MSEKEHPANAIAQILFGDDVPEERAVLEQQIAATPEGDAWLRLLSQVREIERQHLYQGDLKEFRRKVYAAIQHAGESGQTAADAGLQHLVQPMQLFPLDRGQAVGKGILQGRTAGLRKAAGLKSRTLRGILWSASTVIIATLLYLVMSPRQSTATVTRSYTTRSGQQATLTLADGTRVTLAPRTTLRLVRFGTASRTVLLDGQAYFEVAHTTGTPFLVRTGTVTTQVLGTAFLIRHYADDAHVHVAVAEGKVRVMAETPRRSGPSFLTLTAGYVGDVTDSTILANAVDDVTRETDWLRGRLVFQDTPVSQVLQTLSRWYGYQFRCNEPTLTQQKVTVALDARSLSSALSMLERFLNVRLTVAGDTVTITPSQRRSTTDPVRIHEYDVWIPTREVGR
jgi:transmembrane sensor